MSGVQAFKGVWRMQQRQVSGGEAPAAARLAYALYVRPQAWLPVRLIQSRIESEVVANLQRRAAVCRTDAPGQHAAEGLSLSCSSQQSVRSANRIDTRRTAQQDRDIRDSRFMSTIDCRTLRGTRAVVRGFLRGATRRQHASS